MIKDGTRYCDVCEREIPKGARYGSTLIERDYIPPGANIAGTGLTVDGMGNVRLDICSECRVGMTLSGEDMIC